MKPALYTLLLMAAVGFGYYQSSGASRPLHKSVNEPGAAVTLADHFVPGKTNIFYFYADWCGACRQWSDTIEGIQTYMPDMQVHCVDIGRWESAVATQYNIKSVPNFHIFDETGRLLARDRAGGNWLRAELNRRAQARGAAGR